MEIQMSDLQNGKLYRMKFVSNRSYERLAADEAEKLNMHIKVRWQSETREFSFWRQWDLWPALKEWSGITRMISIEDEDGDTDLQWVQGKTYTLRPEGILSPDKTGMVFEWLDEEYKVSFSSEAALWRHIRNQVECDGGLQLTDDKGKQVPTAEIKEGQRYQLRPAEEDQWKPGPATEAKPAAKRELDHAKATPRAPQQEQKITAVWVRMEMEIKYKASWEIWPAIRNQLPMRVGWLILEDESGREVSVEEVKAGGRYQVEEKNTRKPKMAERTMKLKWQDSEIETKYQGTSGLWRAIRDATNFSGRVKIVDDEGKRVDVTRWDINKTYTAQPEKRSYKPSEIEATLRWSKEPKTEHPQKREPEQLTDPREEEKEAPRIIASMWKSTKYEGKLTWALTKSQISHTHPEWQKWEERDETMQVWLHMEDDEV
jgi:hypothetical protein